MKLDCNHFFCKVCVVDYFSFLIMNGKVSDEEFACPNDLHPVRIDSLKPYLEPSLIEKYGKFSTELYINQTAA